MRLNPEKCTFGVQAGKFLGFYFTERGIETNLDKCRAFTELPTPKTKKCIQTLNGTLTSLSRFIAKSAQHALPFFKLLRKETTFEWTNECEKVLKHLKDSLSVPPVFSQHDKGETLIFTSLSHLKRPTPSSSERHKGSRSLHISQTKHYWDLKRGTKR